MLIRRGLDMSARKHVCEIKRVRDAFRYDGHHEAVHTKAGLFVCASQPPRKGGTKWTYDTTIRVDDQLDVIDAFRLLDLEQMP